MSEAPAPPVLDFARTIDLLIGSLDPEATLDGLATLACEGLPAGHVAVLREANGEFVIAAGRGISGLADVPREKTMAAEVARSGKPLRVADLRTSDRVSMVLLAEGKEARSALMAPVLDDGRAVGLIGAYSTEPGAFSAANQELLEALASAAAIAWRNSVAFQAARRRERLGSASAAMTKAASAMASRDEILQIAVDAAIEALGAKGAAILLASEDGRCLRLAADTNATAEDRELLSEIDVASPHLSAKAFRERRTIFYASVTEIEADESVDTDVVRVEGSEAILSTPLVYLGEGLGVMTILFDEEHEFPTDELEAISGLIVQAAAVVVTARAAARLQERADLMRLTLETVGEGIASIDRGGRLTFINGKGMELLGLAGERDLEAAYRRLRFIVGERVVEPLWRLPAPVARGEIFSAEMEVVRADESRVEMAYTASPLRDEMGEVSGCISVFRDIGDERRRAEELTKARERAEERAAQLRGTLEHMSDGVILVDTEGRIVYANTASARLTGVYTDRGVTFAKAAEMLKMSRPGGEELDIPEEYASLRAIITGEQASTVVAIEHEDGRTVTLSVIASPVRTRDGRTIGAVSVMHDISEQSERQQELEELNRLKDDFLSLVSHELKTPLTTIVGYGHLMQRRHQGTDEESIFAFRELLSEANRMVGIINTLLEISRIQSGGLKERLDLDYVDLVGLAANYVRSCQVTYPEVEIISDLPAQRIEVRGDRQRLEQVVGNLVDNAVRYNPPRGKIWVSVRRGEDRVCLTVRDQGPGIEPAERELIFESYGRGEGKHKSGLGLGLYISREIVEAHDGTIEVRGEPGSGATFVVSLPALTAGAEGSDRG